jgi:sigma-B regulation protein RsbU (phosphoserine phosphatase)
LAYMNSNLTAQSDSAMFTTVFYGILDTRTGELQFANGGHNRPYVVGVDGQPRSLSDESGPIVGIMDGFSYDTYTGKLSPGEALVLYTDGVTEARDNKDAFFGETHLEQLLSAHGAESAEQLVASLHAAVQEFATGVPQADDITVLALRFVG